MNGSLLEMTSDLRQHLTLCQELLALAEHEHQALGQAEPPSWFEVYRAKKNLLPLLNQSLDKLRKHRVSWQKLSPSVRAQRPEIASLLRQNQEVIMKIIFLDRENEKGLLRRGLISARELPPAPPQRPELVGEVYRRQHAPV